MRIVEGKTLKHFAYKYISDMIASGEIKPGEAISEQSITDKINISRTPIREALNMLAQENLIELIPNRGAFLKIPSFKETWEIFQIREALEPFATSLCIDRFSNELLDKFRGYIEEAKRTPTVELVEQQEGFHREIIHLCGNDHLIVILNKLHVSIKRLQYVSVRQQGRVLRSILEHEQILNAIADRNGQLASERMREHIISVRDSTLSVIQNT